MAYFEIARGEPVDAETLSFDMADRLRKAREVNGYDQGELALLIDVSRATVVNYEHRNVKANRNTIKLWAVACGVPAEWIFTGVWPEDEPDQGLQGEVKGGPAGGNLNRGARSSTDRASDYGSSAGVSRQRPTYLRLLR